MEKDKEAYKASLKAYRDAYAADEASRRQGRAEGLEEGIQMGIAKGIEKERIESFRNMISFGVSPSLIANKYGISEEEVLRAVEG